MPAAPALLAAAVLSVTPGWDFSLPPDLAPLPGSGLVAMDRPAARPEILHEGATLRWADLNPARGVYDFSRPLALLDAARARGRKVLFRMRTFTVYQKAPWGEEPTAVPQWLLDRYHPTVVDMAAGDDATYPGCVIRVAAPWEDDLRKEHLRFIDAVGRSGIPDHPALLGWYVHGISTSLGEEFWFTRSAFGNLLNAGMTPQLLTESFIQRLRAWAQAFPAQRGRLAWVGSGWIDAPPDEAAAWADAAARIDRAALEAGLGWRGGGIETYHQWFDRQGQSLDAEGHFVTDWAHPFVADGARYFGDENEIHDPARPYAAYMYRAAVLRALAVGMRTLWTGDDAVALDPAVSRYFNLTAGRTGAAAPDAWCWPREAGCRRGRRLFRVKNFERGLLQRDRDGFTPEPDLVTPRGPMWTDSTMAGDWGARTGRMGFHLDAAFGFAPGPEGVMLKVTWLDRAVRKGGTPARWTASYEGPAGPATSPVIAGNGDGREKTTTLRLPDFSVTRTLDTGYGLTLNPVSGPLTVLFVRLTR